MTPSSPATAAGQTALRILLIEDSALDQQILKQTFQERATGDVIVAIPRAEDAFSLLATQTFDIIVADQNLPGMSGLELCRQLLAQKVRLPLVILTGAMNDEVAVEALAIGVADFVVKDASGAYLQILPLKLPVLVNRHRDRLAREEAEAKLLAYSANLKEQNEDLDAFAYMVAHDIVSPLSVLKGYVDTLQLGYGPDLTPQSTLILNHIASSTKKVISIVDALLMLVSARKDAIELEPVEMGEIVAEVIARVGADDCAPVKVASEWPVAIGFGPWIEEVWTNYLSNALKYGGAAEQIELGAEVEPEFIRFYVRDKGPGLDEEEQMMVFYPFQRLEPGKSGHGLGLTIVQRIVEKMGGTVGVFSTPGAGSEFYFRLPKA